MQQLPIAYPYARISDPEQRKGGGLHRQTLDPNTTAKLTEFCRLFEFNLSKQVLVDDGVSAFRGLHLSPDHELGKFLIDARKGRILPGSCLLIENWDRSSRMDIWAAIALVNDLRQLGIHVGRLDRMKLLRCDSTDPGDFFEAAVELMRGHSESQAKSMRNGAAWERKRTAAREAKERKPVLTRRLPAWVREYNGAMELIPERAAVVEEIFRLASSGYGYVQIVKKLTEDKVPAFGEVAVRRKRSQFKGAWTVPYVVRILNDRRAVGWFQPCGRGRKPVGDPVKNYFPAVVTEDDYNAAQGAIDARCKAVKVNRGSRAGMEVRTKLHRVGKHINLFAGLLRNSRDGDTYVYASKGQRVIINTAATEGRSRAWSIQADVFERAVVRCLKEIDPHSILNGDHEPDEAAALAQQEKGIENELAEATAFMDEHGFSVGIGKRVKALEESLRQLRERLAVAAQKAAHPLSTTWGDVQGMLALENALGDPDVRIRLRAGLRRIISSVWLLVLRRGCVTVCAAQIWFADEKKHRGYLIASTPAKKATRRTGGIPTPAHWDVCSLAMPSQGDEMDLRERADAAALERRLLGMTDAELEQFFN